MRYFDFLDIASPGDESTLQLVGSDWSEFWGKKQTCDLVVIFTAHAGDLDVAKDNAKLLKQSLEQETELKVIIKILVGDLEQKNAFNFIDEVIYLNCSDYYEGLPEKVLSGIHCVFQYFDFQWLLKVDANMTATSTKGFVDFIKKNFDDDEPKAFGFVRERNDKVDRGWHKGKCHNQKLNLQEAPDHYPRWWLDGGRGYLLNHKAIFVMLSRLLSHGPTYNYRKVIYEDVLLGRIIQGVVSLSNVDFSKFFTDVTNPLNLRQ